MSADRTLFSYHYSVTYQRRNYDFPLCLTHNFFMYPWSPSDKFFSYVNTSSCIKDCRKNGHAEIPPQALFSHVCGGANLVFRLISHTCSAYAPTATRAFSHSIIQSAHLQGYIWRHMDHFLVKHRLQKSHESQNKRICTHRPVISRRFKFAARLTNPHA